MDTIGTLLAVLYREVSLLQRQICTQLYVVRTVDSVLIREVSLLLSFLYREVPLYLILCPQNATLPKQPAFLFMIDVSAGPLHNGTVNLLAQNVSKMISSLPR